MSIVVKPNSKSPVSITCDTPQEAAEILVGLRALNSPRVGFSSIFGGERPRWIEGRVFTSIFGKRYLAMGSPESKRWAALEDSDGR